MVEANVSKGALCTRKDGIAVAKDTYLEEVGFIVPTEGRGVGKDKKRRAGDGSQNVAMFIIWSFLYIHHYRIASSRRRNVCNLSRGLYFVRRAPLIL